MPPLCVLWSSILLTSYAIAYWKALYTILCEIVFLTTGSKRLMPFNGKPMFIPDIDLVTVYHALRIAFYMYLVFFPAW